MALLVVWPACCCAQRAMIESVPASCCSAMGDEDPDDGQPGACACSAKAPRDLAKDLELPGTPAAPTADDTVRFDTILPPVAATRPPPPVPGTAPPRALLARYGRWQI